MSSVKIQKGHRFRTSFEYDIIYKIFNFPYSFVKTVYSFVPQPLTSGAAFAAFKRQKKNEKESEKLRKPRDASSLFVKDQYCIMRKQNPSLSFRQVQTLVYQSWKEQPADVREKYFRLQDQDRERYENERVRFGFTKRTVCGRALFQKEQFRAVSASNPHATVSELNRLITDRWKALSETDRKRYENAGAADKARYNAEYKAECLRKGIDQSTQCRGVGKSDQYRRWVTLAQRRGIQPERLGPVTRNKIRAEYGMPQRPLLPYIHYFMDYIKPFLAEKSVSKNDSERPGKPRDSNDFSNGPTLPLNISLRGSPNSSDGFNCQNLTRLASQKWKSLDPSTKAVYEAKYWEENAAYLKIMADWKAGMISEGKADVMKTLLHRTGVLDSERERNRRKYIACKVKRIFGDPN